MIAATGIALIGCAARPRTVQAIVIPIDLEGRACSDGDPSVEILSARRFRCGKGDTCTRVDQRIRNPTSSALWFLLDPLDIFSRELDSISILRARQVSRPPPVWGFYGQSFDTALRIPPGADVIARNFEYTQPVEQLRVVFLDRIALSDGREIATLDPQGVVTTHGELDLRGINGFITDYETTDVRRFSPGERISTRVRCILEVGVTAEDG